MKFEEITIQPLNDNSILFSYEDINIRCLNNLNNLIFNINTSKIEDEVLTLMYSKLKKIIINNSVFFEKHDFLNLILWIMPEKYKLNKKLIFYINMSFVLDKIRQTNTKLKNLKNNF